MLFENGLDRCRLEGKEIYIVRYHLVCHDGCRIGVDKSNFDTFFSERSGGL
jgi:hypothetical protein